MQAHMQVLRHPAFCDIKIDWKGLGVSQLYPTQIPDLFHGRPVTLIGRFEGKAHAAGIVVGGSMGRLTRFLPVAWPAAAQRESALPSIWARARITELHSRARGQMIAEEREAYTRKIRDTALEFGLLSAYTAFVAVDSSHRTNGAVGTTVQVPVPVPEGVRYKTTVGGNGGF